MTMFNDKGSKTPGSAKRRKRKATDEDTPVVSTPKLSEMDADEDKSLSSKKKKKGPKTPSAKMPDKEVSSAVKKTPKAEAKTPKAEAKAAKAEVKTPKAEAKTPKAEVKTPKVKAKTPKAEAKAAKAEVKTPKAEVKTPKAEAKTPKAEAKTPKGKVKTPKQTEESSVVKAKKTPKSGKKRKAEEKKEDISENGGGDDSFVVSFPNIESTPKVDSVNDVEENVEKESQTPLKSKKSQETSKTPKKKEAKTTEKTPKKSKMSQAAKVTVEEGTLETTDSSKVKSKAAQKVITAVKPEGKTEKENEKPAKASKRSAQKSDDQEVGTKKQKLEKYLVHCANLPKGVTKETLYFFLGECSLYPEIEFKSESKTVRHGKEKKTKKVMYAVLTFDSQEAADKAVELNRTAMPSPQGGKDRKLLMYAIIERKNDAGKIFMGNLARKTKENDLIEFFQGHDITPDKVIVIRRQFNKQSKGYGFVWFADQESAEKAMKLNNTPVNKKPIHLEFPKSRDNKEKSE